MQDFSFDLETLGTRYDAAILSIGCVQFNRNTGETGATFYKEISIDNALRCGSVSGDTLAWWMQQGNAAREVFGNGREKFVLAEALHQLSSFVNRVNGARVWGNGATFDITILEHAYVNGGHGLVAPWHFANIRDMRTIVDVAAAIGFETNSIKRVGTHHNALDDATYQAKVISACWQAVTGKKVAAPAPKPAAAVPTAPFDDDDDEL